MTMKNKIKIKAKAPAKARTYGIENTKAKARTYWIENTKAKAGANWIVNMKAKARINGTENTKVKAAPNGIKKTTAKTKTKNNIQKSEGLVKSSCLFMDKIKKILINSVTASVFVFLFSGLFFTGCVNQHPEATKSPAQSESSEASDRPEAQRSTDSSDKSEAQEASESAGMKETGSRTQKEEKSSEEGNAYSAESSGSESDVEKDLMSVTSEGDAASDLLKITDKSEIKAVEAAKEKAEKKKGKLRIIATSPATADICDRLGIDLVGVCSSNISKIPERYSDVKKVGTAMAPDMEIVSSLKPDWILSPVSLQSDLQPKYDNIGADWAFLNLRSVPGMYKSIMELGEIFGKEKEARSLTDEFRKYYDDYIKKNEGKAHPKVLVLMGLPGSYIIATENSYVGSLVQLAGGENVYAGTDQEFLTVNTEDMKKKEPDIILRAAHALPDQVVEMFNKDFKTNDIWKHFDAVKNGRVYDLTYDYFGMSAKFNYPDALKELQPILYPESDDDIRKAEDTSRNARKKAEESKAS